MRALLLTAKAEEATNDVKEVPTAIAQLHAFGIDYRRARVENLSAGAIASLDDSYDFILIPAMETAESFADLLNDATLPIPVFGLSVQCNAGGLGAGSGVTGARSSTLRSFCDVAYTDSPYMVHYGMAWTLSGGTPLITASAVDAISGAAQTLAGQVYAWSGTLTASGQRCYYSGCRSPTQTILGLLLQAAINDGAIGAVPRKAPLITDLDHPNDFLAPNDIGLLASFESYLDGGMSWGGQQNGTTSIFENMPANLSAELRRLQAAGSLKFCYHSHRNNPTEQPTTGTWPNTADQITKEEQESIYDSDEAVWNGHGLLYHTPAHNNPGGNRWNEHTLELFSQDRSRASDGANATTKAGKGFVSFRHDSGRGVTRVQNALTKHYFNQHRVRRVVRGIQIFFCRDMGSNLPWDDAVAWNQGTTDIWEAVHYGTYLYHHADDFETLNQGPGETGKKQGVEIARVLRDLGAYCKDVVVPFADPTHYVMPRHSGGVDGVQY